MSHNTSLGVTSRLKSFKAADADISVCSADNVFYRLHRKNLELAADGFPLEGEDLELAESSATLDILFEFIYPQRYVTFDDLDFEALLLLAEAAEKYRIRSAAYGCQVQFRKFVNSNAKDLMAFGVKHSYPSLVLQLAPILVDTPLSELVEILPSSVFITWALYREKWVAACTKAARLMPTHNCKKWGFYCVRILKKLDQPSHLASPSHFEVLFDVANSEGLSSCCRFQVEFWKTTVRTMVSTIPKVSLIVSPGDKSQSLGPDAGLIKLHFSEGHIFALQPKQLKFFTEAFPPVGTPIKDGEKICLSESTATLGLLFQFISSGRYPSLENLDFEGLKALTETAEKYVVYPAIYACQFQLRKFVATKPCELLSLAGKHSYPWIIVQLAPLLIDMPLSEVVELLPLHYYAPWSVYREKWLDGLRAVAAKLIEHKCDQFFAFAMDILSKLDKPSALRAQDLLNQPFRYTGCSSCQTHYDTWKGEVRRTLKAMPQFAI